ncbi:Myosin-10 [Geodia barretti]|uniref:Myosin-10 n=1 Tax=Geodia barretti TaxID=519541 RepID=A0AA35SQT8_GEOBA|nr:Myosin-10 [Geodia barretti]
MADEGLKYLVVDRRQISDVVAHSDWAKKKLVWIPHPDLGFVQGSITSEKQDQITVVLDDGSRKTLSKDDVQKMNPPKFDKVEDMAELSFLNEASVLHNLTSRYYSGLIYTYSGLFCVVVNPYKWLPIYTEKVIDMYKGKKRHEMPPHVYATADQAYRNMLLDRENQSILCTGESGAGKTENTKKVIQYLAVIAGASHHGKDKQLVRKASQHLMSKTGFTGRQGELEAQLLQANPILEAFGNAKTVKNDNSSRFGKFIRINFDQSGFIAGANIETYLLEKSRTIRQAPEERAFHIFYQVQKGMDEARKAEYLFGEASTYNFMSNGYVSVAGINDSAEFDDTVEAMNIMGLSEEEQGAVFRVVSAVLHFGNLQFKQERNSDQALLPDNTVAQKICKLTGMNVSDFTKALLKPKIKTGREFTVRSQNKSQAEFSSQALAKAFYERLFKWIVLRINKSLDRTLRSEASFIGILDIAGFEIFKLNSFEQLCINYTNEKLQQLFNHTMFILEQEEYKVEGIEWTFIDFGLDLQPTIDLIEKPMGILSLLDEECWFPKATDKSYVEKLTREHGTNDKFQKSDFRAKADFILVHYAGTVDYSCEQWLVKNMDPLNDNIVQLLANSNDWFVAQLWRDTANIVGMQTSDAAAAAGKFGVQKTRKGMFRTVGQLYKEQLNKLMDTLRSTQPHFVRCIIPNHEKKAGKIAAQLVLDQLRCNGVLEGIRICRLGFPNRVLFQEFRQRYEILTPGVIPKGFMDGKKSAEKMLTALDLDPASYRIGHSKVFFRAGVLAQLEEERDVKLTEVIVQFQARSRGYLGRKAYQKRVEQFRAIRIIQRNVQSYLKLRNWQWWRLFTKVKPLLQVTNAEDQKREMEEEIKRLNDRHEKLKFEMEAIAKKNGQALSENQRLEEQLREEKYLTQEAEEMKNMLTQKKLEVESLLVDSESRTEELDELNHALQAEKAKLQAAIQQLDEQVEEENASNQKLANERANAENKIKALEEQVTLNDDNIGKLSRDKKSLEEKLQEMQTALEGEENKSKTEHRSRLKLESGLQDSEEKLDREAKRRQELEKEKRKLQQEIAELQEQLAQARQKIDELETFIVRLQKELAVMTHKAEEEAAGRAKAEKEKRDLQTQLQETQDDLESEKEARAKAEKQKRQVNDELDRLRESLEEVESSTVAQQEIRTQRENELAVLKKTLEDEMAAHEDAIAAMRSKHSKAVDELNEQLESAKKSKQNMEKGKGKLEGENESLQLDLRDLRAAFAEGDKRRKTAEAQLSESQAKNTDDAAKIQDITSQNDKLKAELASVTTQLEELDRKSSGSERTVKDLKEQLEEAQERLTEENRAKINSNNKQKQLADEAERLNQQLEDEEEAKGALQVKLTQLTQQLNEAKKKVDDDQLELEEVQNGKRKLDQEAKALQERLEELKAENAKLARGKKKVQGELDDVTVNQESLHSQVATLEKKQKKFDSQLSEQLALAEKNAQERDQAEARARQAETKALSLTRELEGYQDKLDEVERLRKQLTMERDSLVESKDDAGKNVHSLAKAKQSLEAQLEEQKQLLEEVEDELQVCEDARLRLEINLQASKTNYERELAAKEEAAEELRRNLTKQVRELEAHLEEERKQRQVAQSAQKKLETELQDMENQLEAEAKGKEDAQRHYKKLHGQLKESNMGADEAVRAKLETAAKLKDLEKKVRTLEQDLNQAQEEVQNAERARRLAESEREELQDEVQSSTSKANSLAEEKRRIENRMSTLEEDLEEEQMNSEAALDKTRKAEQQADALSTENSQLQASIQKAESAKSQLEKQVKDMKERLEEAESMGVRRMKAQVQAMEGRVSSLEEQLDAATRERATAHRTLRRQDKKLKDVVQSVEDERKQAESYKGEADKALARMRTLKRNMEESVSSAVYIHTNTTFQCTVHGL